MPGNNSLELGVSGRAWRFYDRKIMPYIGGVRGTTKVAQITRRLALKHGFQMREGFPCIEVNGENVCASDVDDFKYFLEETEFVDRFLQELNDADVFVDVGSFHGFYSLLASTQAKSYAFEADMENLTHLQRNSEMNPELDMEIIPQAVWNENTQLNIDAGQGGKTNVEGEGSDVQAVTLNSFFEDGQAPDLIKVDVEGAEGQVLHGGETLLREHRPVLFIEFHTGDRLQSFGYTRRELEEFLKGLGYSKSWERRRGKEVHAVYE